ncbi:MAG TPA: AAA family ATPase [Thermoplasmata archaeon]|nr:AAA family ATPase [Thermoplasmata archaeon]
MVFGSSQATKVESSNFSSSYSSYRLKGRSVRGVRLRIVRIETKGGASFSTGPLTLLVGPNGVGKSTFLSELFDQICGKTSNPKLWIERVSFEETSPADTVRALAQGLVKCYEKANPTNYWYQPARIQAGENQNELRFDQGHFQTLFSISKDSSSLPNPSEAVCNDAQVRRAVTSYLSCDTRLAIPSEAEKAFPYSIPPDLLNVLYQRPELSDSISEKLWDLFGVRLHLLLHSGRTIELGVGVEPLPADISHISAKAPLRWFEETEAWKSANWVPIDRAGHGIRSALNLLSSATDAMRQIILVDEPELFLYPQAKRAFGRILANIGGPARQVFIVTHDAAIVQGAIDTRGDVGVVRLDFGASRSIRSARNTTFQKSSPNSTGYNQVGYLDCLFAAAALVVEGPTDRMFYQFVITEYLSQLATTIMIAAAGGGKAEAVKVQRICFDAGVRSGVVFDFDALFNTGEALQPILEMRSSPFDLAGLKSDIEKALVELTTAGHTEEEAIQLLKQEGVSLEQLSTSTRAALQSHLTALKSAAIFVVPNGRLESWCPVARGKARFVEDALSTFRANPSAAQPVVDFLEVASQSIASQNPA